MTGLTATPALRSCFKRTMVIAAGLFLALVIIELLAVLSLNQNDFSYSLDDAYIHLALAKRIAQGHYGINSGEPSAPSSSILWPVLLAPFAPLPWFSWLPLLLNIGFALLIIAMTGRFWNSFFGTNGVPALAPAANALTVLGLNLVGLAFTGMEHLLQLLMTLIVVFALLRAENRQKPGTLFVVAIIVGPLVRYENTVVSAIALLWLLLHRRRAAFVMLSLATLLPLLGFSFFLHSQGLSWLPSSVQAKSVSLFGGTSSLLANIVVNLNHRQALALLLGALLLVYHLAQAKSKTLPLLTLLAIAVHLIFGRFGWWDRYEVYILAFVFFVLISLFQNQLAGQNRWLILVGIFIIFLPYVLNVIYTPLGCNNIYQQQRQMARFVQQEWPEPVAVNDLGWVAFSNPTPVLDLWGLASPHALQLRRTGRSGAWMDSLAQQHNVRLAMIYDAYFPFLPDTWTCVGKLLLGRRKFTADQPVVSFYATRPQDVAALQRRLSHFRSTLPPGVRLQRVGRLR